MQCDLEQRSVVNTFQVINYNWDGVMQDCANFDKIFDFNKLVDCPTDDNGQ